MNITFPLVTWRRYSYYEGGSGNDKDCKFCEGRDLICKSSVSRYWICDKWINKPNINNYFCLTGVGRKTGSCTGSFFMWGGITLYFCGHFSPDYFQLTHPTEDHHSGPPRGWRMSSVVRLITVCPDTGESESGKADTSSGLSLALLTCHQAYCLISLRLLQVLFRHMI